MTGPGRLRRALRERHRRLVRAGDGRAGSDGRADSDGRSGRDAGTAIIEFVFLAVIVLVPLVYLMIAVAVVQRSELAVSQAAREAGRAFATSPTAAAAPARARIAMRLALADVEVDGAELRYVPAGAGCGAATITPQLRAGAQFTVCVVRRTDLPGVPALLSGRGITTQGAYTVHVDDYRVVT